MVNIGSGEEWSIGQTVEILMELTGNKVNVLCEDQRPRQNAHITAGRERGQGDIRRQCLIGLSQ